MNNINRRLTGHELTFSGAGERRLQVRGRHVLITAATNDVYIAFDDQSFLKRGKKSNIDAGYEFTVVVVKSLVAQTVELTISDVRQDEGRDDVVVTTTATVAPGNNIKTTTDASIGASASGVVIAANANRLSVTIKNLSSNASVMRVGELGGVGAARGHPLDPGESITFDTSAALYAYNTDASLAQSVSIIENEII